MTPRLLVRMATLLALAVSINATTPTQAAGPTIGFLAPTAATDQLGPEGQAAWRLAGELGDASLVVCVAEQAPAFDAFDIVWYHAGDSTERPAVFYGKKTLAALRTYVDNGGGLFLSGAALGMTRSLGVEPVAARVGGPGNDSSHAAIVPVETGHPIFKGLSANGRPISVSDAGHPAFADFHALGGPAGGMLLARTPGASENPLVEYELGKGRVIAMGWRLPHYSHAQNAFRSNLEGLTRNIVAYLADRGAWGKVVVRPVPGPPRPKVELGVPERDWKALELAVNDLVASFPDRYGAGPAALARLTTLKQRHDQLMAALKDADENPKAETLGHLDETVEQFKALKAEALLANPLLDFDRLLLVMRSAARLGLPTNYQSNSSLPTTGYDNQIAVLSPVRPDGQLTTLLEPEGGRFVGDVDLHFDGSRMLFSMPGSHGRWRIFEMDATGDAETLRELPLIPDADVDNYDACYLPDGRIIFSSTAPFVGVPCVRGSSHVTNLYILETDGRIRQLTVDQEHNWCPTVMNNGRVMYLRWEYTDLPHAFYRLLFHMNPDGTEQMEYYGSNSYWPNAMFFARPLPNHPTKVVTIVGGHHDNPRMGELVVLDPALGRSEADGAVQRIPGHGEKVEPILLDGLTKNAWPRFLHPYPLSEKHFLVSCQPTAQDTWGIYLVDTFDNFVLLTDEPGYAMLEPIPLRATRTPPAIPDRVDPRRNDATVFLADVYQGPGLKGIPRGTVKSLRLISYHYSYHGMGGQVDRVGLDGPWDVKWILGTVPVEADGSAKFRVPAYTPIAVQPLDAEGKAVQLMRSWFTAMPGETLSCVGCHERQNTSPPPAVAAAASGRAPSDITPWYGPARGFSFRREVQPVLDRHCLECHNGQPRADELELADLTDRPDVNMWAASATYNEGAHFSPSYFELRRFVRSPTIESDLHMLAPRDFHADTTKLVQMLQKGHYGVELDAEGWDRLITWIDLHTPAHGTWTDICGSLRVDHQRERRQAMRLLYTGRDENPEMVVTPYVPNVTPQGPPSVAGADNRRPTAKLAGWPFDPAASLQRRTADGAPTSMTVTLAEGVELELSWIPSGRFLMGDSQGYADERPEAPVAIERPFWIGRCELTNAQYAAFDPSHDSRLEHGDFLQFSHLERGYPLNLPDQPVVRVSWLEAMDFCRWLSAKTGFRFMLPTEAQWEYACRAGSDRPLWYGELDDDFSSFANVSDATHHSVDTFGWSLPSGAIPPWRVADARFDDKHRVSAAVASFAANAWGLYDTAGNVAEWTRTAHAPLPYDENDGRNQVVPSGKKAVRGGSWYDRPNRCRSGSRLAYPADQVVFDVGFRVICEEDASEVASVK